MSELPAFLVLGLIQGMTYGVVALGMVLIYKGSRVLNLAQPFMGLFVAFLAWWLTFKVDTSVFFLRWLKYVLIFEPGTRPRFVTAALLSLLLIARISYRLEHDLMRRLERSPRLVNLVVTIALAQGFLGVTNILFNRTEAQATEPKRLLVLLPESWTFNVGVFPVTAGFVQILIVVPILAAAAALFFKFTKFGVAIRASAENREAAQLLGISARRVASFTWLVGGVLAGIAALLIVPAQGSLDVTSLSTGLLVRALAAALVGGLTSLPGALAGGVVVGVAEFLTRWRTDEVGIPETVFFVLVIAVLVFRPGGLLGQRERLTDEIAFAPAFRELPARLRRVSISARARWTAVTIGIMLASAASLATGPFTNGVLIEVLVFGILGVSLTVLIGYAGQISLGHFALLGVGAFAAGNMYDHGPIPFWLVLPLVFLTGMVVSLVIGLPALRIRGPYLAVVTIAFAVAATQWIFRSNLFARGSAGVTMTPPDFGWLDLSSQTNRPLFFFGFAIFLVCCWLAYNFKQSRTGRGFFSLRENEKAAATFGVQLTRYRLLAFMLSGGMAALGGVVFALRAEQFAALDFPAELSLQLVLMVIIGGLGSLAGAGLGAFLVAGVPVLLQQAFGQDAPWVPYAVLFGTGTLTILVITRARGGLAGLIFRVRDPVVEGLVWQERELETSAARATGDAIAAGDGDGRRAEPGDTIELTAPATPKRKPAAKRSTTRKSSAKKAGSTRR